MFLAQNGISDDRPFDTDSRIIPAQGALGFGRIVIAAFVDDFAVGLERNEAMGKPRRNVKLRAILGTQREARPFAIGWAATSNIAPRPQRTNFAWACGGA